MTMLVARACKPGLAGVDLLGTVTPAIAKGFRAEGKSFVMQYGKIVTADAVAAITDEGMGLGIYSFGRQGDFSPTTGAQDAEEILDHLRSIGVPVGNMLTLTLDLETPKGATIADVLAYEKQGWAAKVTPTGCTSGAYLGAGLLMTSAQYFSMAATRYVKSGSRLIDTAGNAAEPECGYVMTQVLPFDQQCGGAEVDFCFSGHDYFGRSMFMVWAIATGSAFSIPSGADPNASTEPPPPPSNPATGGGS